MFALVTVSAVLAFLTYLLSWKLRSRWVRIALATTVFLVLAVVPIVILLVVGDEASPGSRVVTQEKLERAARP